MTKKKVQKEGPLPEQKVEETAADVKGKVVAVEEKDLAKELEEARQQLAECQDRLLRMAADFDNTKKRLEREREITLNMPSPQPIPHLNSRLTTLVGSMRCSAGLYAV